MNVRIKRVYEAAAERDGTRVLVDRLWPRGLSKAEAELDAWAKQLAPSPELRKWFGHDPQRFDRFAERYRRELVGNRSHVEALLAGFDRRRRLTLLYAAKDPVINHAAVLRDFLVEGG